MPKRFKNIILITFLILLGIFFIEKLRTNKPISVTQQSASLKTTSIPTKATTKTLPSTQAKASAKKQTLSEQLQDLKKTAQDRVYIIKGLDLSQSTQIGKKNIEQLVAFITSINPYKNAPQVNQPHSFKAIQFNKEASLRVYSLKRLSKTLDDDSLKYRLNSIIENSQDSSIIRIAKQVIEAREKGQNYFKNIKEAIKSMPLPNDKLHKGH